jgi:prepilin-type processing-associated H-X9-DG protein
MRLSNRNARNDFLASVLLVLVIGTLTIGQVQNAEETANRIKCSSNLRQIGQAILLYSNDNRGGYPRTTYDVAKPTPVWGTPYEGNAELGAREQRKVDAFIVKNSDVVPAPNDVTAALFLLLRTQDITSEVFICPSTGLEKWDFGGKTNAPIMWTNWPGKIALADHLSYSYQNPYPTKEAIAKGFKLNNSITAEFAIAGDMNPGIDALTKVPMSAGPDAIRVGNSANHGGDGQNILYGDGHVEFQVSPYVGVERDNIYTFGDTGTKFQETGGVGIVGPSVGPNDSVLLPTARDLGVIDANGKMSEAARKRRLGVSPDMKPATPQQQADTKKKLAGNYVQTQNGRRIKLTISDTQLVASSGPVTITFAYAIADLGADGSARLVLTAPETPDTSTRITMQADGVTIKGGQLQGKWTKQ